MVIADRLKVRSECVKRIQQLLLQNVLLCEAEANAHRALKHDVQVIHIIIDVSSLNLSIKVLKVHTSNHVDLVAHLDIVVWVYNAIADVATLC